jgi:aspartyl-tRNA(Asn)/glutamyl-tRNA(Gln) amidotransferase subunit C
MRRVLYQAMGTDFQRLMYESPPAIVKRSAYEQAHCGAVNLDTWMGDGLTTDMDASELLVTARMARLTLSGSDLEKLRVAVEQMLAHFSHMKEIDVEGLPPTTHALLRENRLRDDTVAGAVDADTLLDNSPEREERFIVIPNVL